MHFGEEPRLLLEVLLNSLAVLPAVFDRGALTILGRIAQNANSYCHKEGQVNPGVPLGLDDAHDGV